MFWYSFSTPNPWNKLTWTLFEKKSDWPFNFYKLAIATQIMNTGHRVISNFALVLIWIFAGILDPTCSWDRPIYRKSKIPAKMQIYIITRAEFFITLCYEIPCITISATFWFFSILNQDVKTPNNSANEFWRMRCGLRSFK